MHVKKRELLGTTWGMAVINLRHVFAQQVIRVLKKWMEDVMTSWRILSNANGGEMGYGFGGYITSE
ncbi:hypothetical protein [Bacillus pseudomycoides]|uniref:hypothetical protein n=1 Tax=Bacillus pseudomycoides TaxID=64104 RepID=UPI001596A6B8